MTLDLSEPTYDHYQVELRRGVGDEQTVLRSHKAMTTEDAVGFIEALRDVANQRYGVTWKDEEVDGTGSLFGLGPERVIYEVHVTPALSVVLR